jgi:hypothetical protein
MAIEFSASTRAAHPLDYIKRPTLCLNVLGSSRCRRLTAARATDNKQQGWSFPWSKPQRGESDSEYEYVYVTDSGAADDVIQQPAAPAAVQHEVQQQQQERQQQQQQQQHQASVSVQDAGAVEQELETEPVVEVVAAAGAGQVRCFCILRATADRHSYTTPLHCNACGILWPQLSCTYST